MVVARKTMKPWNSRTTKVSEPANQLGSFAGGEWQIAFQGFDPLGSCLQGILELVTSNSHIATSNQSLWCLPRRRRLQNTFCTVLGNYILKADTCYWPGAWPSHRIMSFSRAMDDALGLASGKVFCSIIQNVVLP